MLWASKVLAKLLLEDFYWNIRAQVTSCSYQAAKLTLGLGRSFYCEQCWAERMFGLRLHVFNCLVLACKSQMVKFTIYQSVWYNWVEFLPSHSSSGVVWVMSLWFFCLKKSLENSFVLWRSPWYCRSRNALTRACPKDVSLTELWFIINFALNTLKFFFQLYFSLKHISALSTCVRRLIVANKNQWQHCFASKNTEMLS